MAISYDALTNIITVTGYTGGTPCNFTDLYNADVAGAWGVVHRNGLQFRLDARLWVSGTAETSAWFADTLKQIYLSELIKQTGSSSYVINSVNSYSHLRLGECTDATLKTTRKGCSIKFPESGGHSNDLYGYNWELYSCSLFGPASYAQRSHIKTQAESKIYHNNWSGYIVFNGASNTDVYDLVHGGSAETFSVSALTFERVISMNMTYGVEYSGIGVLSFKDIIIRNCTHDVWMRTSLTRGNAINFDVIGDWDITWSKSPSYPFQGDLYRQYTFNLHVLAEKGGNIESATVKVWDKDNNLVVETTTDVNGLITEQTLDYKRYSQHAEEADSATDTHEYSPHEIQISKSGYKTYTNKFELDEKVNWKIALKRRDRDGILSYR